MASDDMKRMMKQKTEVESELKELHDVLHSHNTNMVDELVDKEGFPRSDVDVLTIRKTRVRIIYLQNDLKKLMVDIEEELHRLHAVAREQKPSGTEDVSKKTSPTSNLVPFLRVDDVIGGSPADKAGLEVNDLIMRFGSVTLTNFAGLQTISSVVQHSKGEEVLVAVQRSHVHKTLKLVPNTWSGKGLLGCSVVPVKSK